MDPSTPRHVVVIGGGLAGAKTVEALRDEGYEGHIALVAAEQQLPYDRPPLSKEYLKGEVSADDITVHPAAWYAEHGVDVRCGTAATTVDAKAHRVQLEDGTTLEYDKLVLATGSTPRTLPLPGADADGVHTLRHRDDCDAIRSCFGDGRRLVVIGGGWIGLEVAAAAREAQTQVTVLEVGDLPLLAVLGPQLARVFADLHTEHGVDLRTEVKTEAILTRDDKVVGVQLADGTTIDADAVLIGVGATPNLQLAKSAGLDLDDGVLVDASLRSSDPDIFAVGDIAAHDHPVLGHRVRVEHWDAAMNQPAVAASALLGGDATYRRLPYFYTDQYDLGMEYAGHAPSGSYARVVVRGDLRAREFVAFWLDAEDRIKAAMNVNVWDVLDEIKPLIVSGRTVDAERLADPGVAYTSL